MKKIIKSALLLIAGATASFSIAVHAAEGQAQDKQLGKWLTQSGNLEVEIAPCGEALCGTIVKVLANRSMSNPNVTMASSSQQSVLGTQMLKNLVAAGDNEWKGEIYNRENNETYDCIVSLVGADQLKILAYKGQPSNGRTQVWRRVTAAGQQ